MTAVGFNKALFSGWNARMLSLGFVAFGALIGRGSYLVGGSLLAARVGPDVFSIVGLGLTGASFIEAVLVCATGSTIVRSVSMVRAAGPAQAEEIVRLSRKFFLIAVIVAHLIGSIAYLANVSIWLSEQQP